MHQFGYAILLRCVSRSAVRTRINVAAMGGDAKPAGDAGEIKAFRAADINKSVAVFCLLFQQALDFCFIGAEPLGQQL